jgi:iron complex transport system substrate-binding protein
MSCIRDLVMDWSRAGLGSALALGLVLGGTGIASAQDDAAGETATLTDFRGKTLEAPVGAQNVVFLVENAMNTFYAVGGADNVSGIGTLWQPDYKVDFFSGVDPDFADMPIIGTTDGAVDLEALAATDPDLVVLWSADIDDKDTTAIESSLGIPVYGVFLTSFDDLTKLTEDMAAILGDAARGEEVVAQIAAEMADITAIAGAIPEEERPTVYWMWNPPFRTAGTVSTANDLITAAGGINVIETWDDPAKTEEAVELPMETIAALDPEVIYMWFNAEIDPQDIIEGAQVAGYDFSAWSGLSAVQNERVFELDDPFLYDFMTGRQPIATLKIAKDIHPEAFADVDLETEYDEFFEAMYGVSYPDFQPAG